MKKLLKPIVQIYLKLLTRFTLWRHRPLIVAVAGTTNKTFLKETILDELGRGEGVRGNPKSFNTEIGLPLAVLFLPSGYSSLFKWVDVLLTGTSLSLFSRRFPKVLVLEMGVDRPGDMEYLLSMISPTIAVITTIDRSLVETGTSIDEIAREMEQLVRIIPSEGTIILNGDDGRVKELARSARGRTVFYGQSIRPQEGGKIRNLQEEEAGQSFIFEYQGKEETIQTQRFGRHHVSALAAAKIVKEELSRIKKEKQK